MHWACLRLGPVPIVILNGWLPVGFPFGPNWAPSSISRSSSREVRIRVPTFFGFVYFSRGTLPTKKVGQRALLKNLAKGSRFQTVLQVSMHRCALIKSKKHIENAAESWGTSLGEEGRKKLRKKERKKKKESKRERNKPSLLRHSL